jgi:hypothetical protein
MKALIIGESGRIGGVAAATLEGRGHDVVRASLDKGVVGARASARQARRQTNTNE